MTKKARFLVVEGVDFSGKGTQLDRIETFLRLRGLDVVRFREPGGTRIGEKIRAILLDKEHAEMATKTELLLFCASRAQLLEEQIFPALDQGKLVLCDRYYYSSAAYQGLHLYGANWTINLSEDWLRFPEPHMVLYLDGNPEVLARRAGRELDRIEQRGVEFQRQVREAYQNMADHRPELFRTVNAERPIEDVWKDVEKILESEVLGEVVRG